MSAQALAASGKRQVHGIRREEDSNKVLKIFDSVSKKDLRCPEQELGNPALIYSFAYISVLPVP